MKAVLLYIVASGERLCAFIALLFRFFRTSIKLLLLQPTKLADLGNCNRLESIN